MKTFLLLAFGAIVALALRPLVVSFVRGFLGALRRPPAPPAALVCLALSGLACPLSAQPWGVWQVRERAGADTTCLTAGVVCPFAGSASEGGPATTALALSADPAACPSGQFVRDVAASGALTCATPAGGGGGAFDPLSLQGLRLWLRASNPAINFSGGLVSSGSAVRELPDTSGNHRPMVQGTAGIAPLMVGNATPTGRAAVNLAGMRWMASSSLSAFGSASTLIVVAVVRIDSIARSSSTSYANDAIVVDGGSYWGMYAKGPSSVVAYNWDGSEDQVSASITLGTWHVVIMRHSGGTLGLSVDGGAEVTVASGNTADMSGPLWLGSGASMTGLVAEVLVLAQDQDLSGLVSYLSGFYGM